MKTKYEFELKAKEKRKEIKRKGEKELSELLIELNESLKELN